MRNVTQRVLLDQQLTHPISDLPFASGFIGLLLEPLFQQRAAATPYACAQYVSTIAACSRVLATPPASGVLFNQLLVLTCWPFATSIKYHQCIFCFLGIHQSALLYR